MSDPENQIRALFQFFTEVGIIGQLSGRLFETHLPDGFLVSHFAVISHLVRLGDGRTPLSLSRDLQVPKTTMTHTLSVLRKADYIDIRTNPNDSRSKLIFLTPTGRDFHANAFSALIPDLEKVVQNLDVERIARTLPVLEDMRKYLDRARD